MWPRAYAKIIERARAWAKARRDLTETRAKSVVPMSRAEIALRAYRSRAIFADKKPEHRNRGNASAAITHLLQRILPAD
ncbi:unnamed protein product [Leptosia nina]|uniref:Uncharacterized protein n=1 Tax=Leptosia nina TaxID=320188 RepID=A0AAV1IUL5_9NEOP